MDEFTFSEIMNLGQKYKYALGACLVTGIGLYATRRYLSGGRCRSRTCLDGKTVIITGANTGIGKETAKDLARRGARVILACRDVTKAERAAESIRKSSGNSQVIARKLDLASLASVRSFANNIKNTEKQVNILINNAGVMACPRWQTEDCFEMQLGTNHLGHFLLTHELLDMLKSSAPSRIVNVSSKAHCRGSMHWDDLQLTKDYDPRKAYHQSKLANILFTKELHRRLAGSGVTAYSLHPGIILTQLWQHLPKFLQVAFTVPSHMFFKNVEEGAQTTLHCALAEGIEADSGKYFSDCSVKKPSALAESEEDARRLWDVSEVLVGIEPSS